jgi:hypothetical protein
MPCLSCHGDLKPDSIYCPHCAAPVPVAKIASPPSINPITGEPIDPNMDTVELMKLNFAIRDYYEAKIEAEKKQKNARLYALAKADADDRRRQSKGMPGSSPSGCIEGVARLIVAVVGTCVICAVGFFIFVLTIAVLTALGAK